MKTRTTTALLLLSVLTLTACGARLSQDDREAAIAMLTGSGTRNVSAGGTGDVDTGLGGTDIGTTDTGDGSAAGAGGAATGGGTTTGGGSTGSSGGGSTSGGSGGTAASGACPGGARTASDKGVTASEITVVNLSDITGPAPGLFKTAQQAIGAWAAYVNSTGRICGRSVKVKNIDSKTDSGANNAGALDACDSAFALVGSMSAFDDGGAQTIDSCGIPDITAIPVNKARQKAKNTYGAYPNQADRILMGPPTYIKNTYGDAVIKNAGFFWLNGSVTRDQAQSAMRAYSTIGYDFKVRTEVQVVEPNYCPYVVQMRDEGVQYVTAVADVNSHVRFLQAIRQCGGGWNPKVKDWQPSVYTPAFLSQGGADAEGSFLFMNNGLFEEAASIPEMQLYLQWLGRTAPGAKPDYFGLWAWSAGRLFQKVATAAGTDLKRTKVFDELKKIHDWTAEGLHAVQDTGNKLTGPCFLYAQVKGGKFQRLHPASGWNCTDAPELHKL